MGSTVFPAPSGAKSLYKQEFTSGTTSWTAPDGVNTIECLLVAGGGGGGGVTATSGNAAGSGGGGQVVKTYLTVTPGTAYSVVIGAGGAGNTAGNNGSNGSNSSFGSLLICGGGGYGAGAAGADLAGGNGNAGTNARGGGNHGSGINNNAGGQGLGGSGGGGNAIGRNDVSPPAGGGAGGQAMITGLNGSTNGFISMAGPGLYGFGAGGCNPRGRGPAVGIDAVANTGNGGVGATSINGATANSGGTGGSGYCLISWWA